MAYRVTPHSTTNIAPADLMYQRKIRYTIPDINHKVNKNINKTLEQRDKLSKTLSKQYMDNRKHAKASALNIGVLVKQRKQNKLTPPFNPNPYNTEQMKGTLVTVS